MRGSVRKLILEDLESDISFSLGLVEKLLVELACIELSYFSVTS